MSLINFKKILSSTNADKVHSAENLLKFDQTKSWLSSKATDEQITCIIEFEKPSFISSIDIGNDGSAFIELFVSQSSEDDWTILLLPTNLMTPDESRSNSNRNRIKSIKSEDLNKTSFNSKWIRLKIICEQKFNKTKQFGLNFIKLYSISNKNNSIINDEEDETEIEQNRIGEFFAKKQIEKTRKSICKNNNQLEIMKNVVFVLSGFQNPLRSDLRTKAISMGATYSEDWNKKCTHLICAFPNTPKYAQVDQSGHGIIVNKQWIIDCYKKNQLLSEKLYQLKEIENDDDDDDDNKSNTSKDMTKKTPIKRKSNNKNDNLNNKIKFDELPDFFHDIHFYVSYGDYNDNTLLDMIRIIFAYDGILERQINENVQYVITNRMWNQDFEKISKSNPNIQFVNLDWLQDCHNTNKFVPVDSYLIVR